MLLKQRRIRNLDRHLPQGLRGQRLRVCVGDLASRADRLLRIGIAAPSVGDTVLPSVVGPISRFNAEGKQIVRRDLEMETAYREVQWTRVEFHGKERVEVTEFTFVPYRRYPRDQVAPASLEVTVVERRDGGLLLTLDPIEYEEAHEPLLRHAINLFLEAFGECEIVTEDLQPIDRPAQIRRLNWDVLPQGRYPWERLQPQLAPILNRASVGKRPVIGNRFSIINAHGPQFIAVGRGGFTGYVVFGFPERSLYIVESAFYGNATYVFGDDWEALSQMTKAQILNNDLQRARIIHQHGWEEEVRKIL